MKAKQDIVISVVIPCYNLGVYLNDAIDSVLKQTLVEFEIIVVNDGSTDHNTNEIVNRISHPKIKVLNISNSGLATARNTGITEARGKYICCLDADDKIDPTYFQKAVNILDQDDSIGIVTPWLQEFGERTDIWKTSGDIVNLIADNSITVAAVYRKECWKEVGGYDKDMPTMGYEDWDLWLSIVSKGWKVFVIPETLFHYRIRNNSMLGSASDKRLSLIEYLYNKHKDLFNKYGIDTILKKEESLIYLRNELKQKDSIVKNIETEKQLLTQKLNEVEKTNSDLLNQISHLQNQLNVLSSNKFIRLRNVIKEEKLSFKKILKIFYLCFAIVTPEFVRSRLRSTISQIRTQVYNSLYSRRFFQQGWIEGAPLVSVVIPCFNYGEYINEAIDSVLNQTFKNFEIIVVEGGSTDGKTPELVKSINKPKTKIFFRNEPHLVGDNRNYGIERARGKYICCLDADDKLDPTYLEKALFCMETENLDMFSPSLEFFGDETGPIPLPHSHPKLENLLSYNCFYSVTLFTKDLWEKSGGYKDYGKGKDHIPEDWELWVKMMAIGARVRTLVSDYLLKYRKHGDSLSDHKEVPSYGDQIQVIRKENQAILTPENFARSNKANQLRFYGENNYLNLVNSFEEKKETVLFVLPYTVMGGADKRFQQVSKLISTKTNVAIITTLDFDRKTTIDTTPDFQTYTNEVYNLPRFLESLEQYRQFFLYFLKTRNVKSMYLGGSEYFYSILPEIKTLYPHIKVVDMQFNTTGHFANNRKYSKYIDITIAENDEVKNKIIKEFHDEPKKVIQILSGVDTNKLSKEKYIKSRPEVLPKNKFIVSYIGRWSSEKGPDIFLQTAKELKNHSDICFVLCGAGPEEANLLSYINENTLSNVVVAGMINPAEYMAHSDLMLLPSRLDGRPYALLEAMSMSLPVIGANVGGIPDIIIDGENGILCNPEDPKSFANAILQLQSDNKLREKISANSRNYAIENFDIERENQAYLKLLIQD